jgi:S-adenosylmethionine synthetase
MAGVILQRAEGPMIRDLEVEIVERKGLGHPDTLCDNIMEHVAQALARLYLERTGAVRHFNCDKALLAAGRVDHRWGGGSVTEPMRFVIGDRATTVWNGEDLHVGELAVETARRYIRRHLRHVDPVAHLVYDVALQPGSPELAGLYAEHVMANDTAAGVGYAPMTEAEQLVLETERYANSAEFKVLFPETGEDVKVMGARSGRALELTVAMPLLDRCLSDEGDYFERKDRIHDAMLSHVRSKLATIEDVALTLNATDHRGGGLAGIYTSVLGISAESADSGEVGRGNRANGLISFCRPGGAEAIAGKNPIGHVGKIYGMLAFALAETLVGRLAALAGVTVWIYSQIGQPIDQPRRIFLLTDLAPGAALSDVESAARAVVDEELANLPAFCRALMTGERKVPGGATRAASCPATRATAASLARRRSGDWACVGELATAGVLERQYATRRSQVCIPA